MRILQRSSRSAASRPKPCRLEGLAQAVRWAAAMAASTSGAGGAVAQASR
ncbi:hypothetical protein [Cyanobium sp. LEGE 06113]